MTPSVRERLGAAGVVAVVRAPSPAEAYELAAAAARGGAAALEITYTVPDAAEVIARLAAEGHLVGAGTVTTPAQLEGAVGAGAQFLVSPVAPPWFVGAAAAAGVLAVPGTATPQEVWTALESGAEVVKVFPAARLGGPAYLRDLLGPFPGLQVMASGGLRRGDLAAYRDVGAWCIGVGALAWRPDPRS